MRPRIDDLARRLIGGFLVGLLACAGGCEESNSGPAVRAGMGEHFLSSEPAGAVSFADARKQLEENPGVVVMGRIGAKDFDPWIKGEAAFLVEEALPEALGHDHGPGHDPDDCPFCRRRRQGKDFIATVRFLDAKGRAIKTDAQTLLGLKKGDVVVVQGTAEIGDLDTLVINATGLFIKPGK